MDHNAELKDKKKTTYSVEKFVLLSRVELGWRSGSYQTPPSLPSSQVQFHS